MKYLYISNIYAALLTAKATNNNTNTCPSNKILPNHLANLVDVLFEIEKCFHLIIFLQSMELDIGGPQRSFQYCPVESLDYSDFTEKVHFSATALAVTRPAQGTFAVIKWNLQSSVIRKEYT